MFSSRATRIFGFLFLKLTFCFHSASNSAISTNPSSMSFSTSLMVCAPFSRTSGHFVTVFSVRTQCGWSSMMGCNGFDVLKMYGFLTMKVLLKALGGKNSFETINKNEISQSWLQREQGGYPMID